MLEIWKIMWMKIPERWAKKWKCEGKKVGKILFDYEIKYLVMHISIQLWNDVFN